MKKSEDTHILILGGGFAGLTAAKKIAAQVDIKNTRITLIDQNTYHLYTPDLYEVATATKSSGMRRTVAVSFSEALRQTGVKFLHDTVEHIDIKKNLVRTVKNGDHYFSHLIIALGSVANFYNITGLQEHAYSFKTLDDAARINEKIRELCNSYKKKGGPHSTLKCTTWLNNKG